MLSLIAAVGENYEIGRKGRMPWHLPADLKRFKSLTMGKPVIMGRKTFEAIGRPLAGRRNIIITREPKYAATDCAVVHSLPEALIQTAGVPEVMVIGGAQIYREALPRAQRIYLTQVHAAFEADTHFPQLDTSEWREIACEQHLADAHNAHAYSFIILERLASRNLV